MLASAIWAMRSTDWATAVLAELCSRIASVISLTIATVVVVLFSAYILYDISRIVQGGETNYISATLAVYLDVYNVFVSLLQLIMAFTGDRD